ncbi:hypothetical protein Pelo_9133 [Pelomyxa schiedti]|nr:hypothetical protein Pelo_9133 [Pelomyxa schiedti]
MIEFCGGILARDQAVALLLCRNTQLSSVGEVTTTKGKGTRPMGKLTVSLLPQCVLRELIQSWVLEPSRCVAIHMESPDPCARFYPFDAMYVLLSVSHTLGVTGGTPKVLKSYETPVPNVRFLSPTVMLRYDSHLLSAVDLTGKRDTAVVWRQRCSAWGSAYNHKWLVFLTGSRSLRVWRLCRSFPEGDPLDLPEIGAEGLSALQMVMSCALWLTRSTAAQSELLTYRSALTPEHLL